MQNLQTSSDRFRSFSCRELSLLIKFSNAKLACHHDIFMQSDRLKLSHSSSLVAISLSFRCGILLKEQKQIQNLEFFFGFVVAARSWPRNTISTQSNDRRLVFVNRIHRFMVSFNTNLLPQTII